MSRTMKELVKCFEIAREQNKEYVGVAVTVPGCDGYEIIVNPKENFDVKQRYYQNAYTDELKLSTFNIIKIVAFASGNTFEEIYWNIVVSLKRNEVEARHAKDAETR